MNHRSALACLTAVAVTTGLATGLASSPATAAVPDPAPVAEGSDWLAGQLTDGLVFNPNFGGFTDYGLSVDAGLALAEVGDAATVDEISAALAPQVRSYYTYDAAPGKTHVAAGSLAKATAFAQVAGDDAAAYGGQDLVEQLEARVSTDVASAGRISDVFFPEEPFESDFSNTIGQAFAVRALDAADSPRTDAATDFLLAQQCAAGFFRLTLGDTVLETCDTAVPPASPSTDVTALAVLNLLGQVDGPDADADAEAAAAVDDAVAWLVANQNPDGSFGSDAEISTANANSTGLAGWALGEAGQTAAAEKAATWLRAHQVVATATCSPYAAVDEGAIAYDDAALKGLESAAISPELQDQFRRATAQALPALRSAPSAAAGDPVAATRGFVRVGSTQQVRVAGAPGDLVCLTGPGTKATQRVDADGRIAFAVSMVKGTATRTYRVEDGDETLGAARFRVLGAQRLKVTAPDAVERRSTVRLTAAGLERGEKATFRFRGDKVGTDRAGSNGRASVSVRLTGRPGRGEVAVVGAFGIRKGATSLRLTR